MDASGQFGAVGKRPAALRQRELPLRGIALAGSLLVWIAMFAISVSVVIWHARDSVRRETESAFMLAKAAATLTLPTAFQRRDVMAEATRIAADIRAQRHVTAELRDAAGQQVQLPAMLPVPVENDAPEWFARLFRPPPMQDVFPITQYPNVLGLLEIRTEPSDAIAEIWRDLTVLVPLLLVTGLLAVGSTMALTLLVVRRLNQLGAGLERMRIGELDAQTPRSGLAELDALGEGIDTLASHLARERAENRLLQGRMLSLAEAERARIATDLHDEIGPRLFALRAAVEQARRQDVSPELAENLAAIAAHSDAIRDSARAAIDDLRPSPDDAEGLEEMIRELLIDFGEAAPQVAFDLHIPEALPEPGESGRIAMYRFIRESVLNALRHARPTHIAVEIQTEGRQIRARVCDDGPAPLREGRRGLGHQGMRDRAAAIGADWLPPRRDGGMTVTEFRMTFP
ncbi:LapD/MoxY N-terminal periplasmic domain-containing protein [Paracoccus sp. PAR01]|uniref:LapD/MoxY N-terminal periplasmic domain-containing protein n=1 Tax=Paracoccus sp. PAR01 TaxID=2769282 RepID=UPI00177C0510|nr:LapD/MoxY N-terminal periplasmic domain-containing protein [Paracoccus sp. PAR01]MBD9525426.1 histidine kinase [Paracoccus sp. PAR01]